jgi:hypothetical protein
MINSFNHFGKSQQLWPPQERIGYQFLDEVFHFHKEQLSEFSRRPITSFSIEGVHRIFGMEYAESFIIVEFGMWAVVGVLIWIFSRKFGLTEKEATFSVLLWFSSFTIFFSFFASIFTYDEPFQYFFFYLFFAALLKKKRWWSTFFLFITFLAKDASIFLLPGIFVVVEKLTTIKCREFAVICFGALLLYGGWLTYYFVSSPSRAQETYQFSTTHRLPNLIENFQNREWALETILVLLLPFLLPFLLLFLTKKKKTWKNHYTLLEAAMVTWLINSPIVLLIARAQEARNFALPLLFIWPILGGYLSPAIQFLKRTFGEFRKKSSFVEVLTVSGVSLLILSLLYIFAIHIYWPTLAIGAEMGYRIYVFVTLVLAYLGFLALLLHSRKET